MTGSIRYPVSSPRSSPPFSPYIALHTRHIYRFVRRIIISIYIYIYVNIIHAKVHTSINMHLSTSRSFRYWSSTRHTNPFWCITQQWRERNTRDFIPIIRWVAYESKFDQIRWIVSDISCSTSSIYLNQDTSIVIQTEQSEINSHKLCMCNARNVASGNTRMKALLISYPENPLKFEAIVHCVGSSLTCHVRTLNICRLTSGFISWYEFARNILYD